MSDAFARMGLFEISENRVKASFMVFFEVSSTRGCENAAIEVTKMIDDAFKVTLLFMLTGWNYLLQKMEPSEVALISDQVRL